MKKCLILFVLCALLLCACGEEPTAGPTIAPEPGPVWTREELPLRVRYERLWFYGDSRESEDAALIEELVGAIRALRVLGPSDLYTTDYTDLLFFSFPDGTELRLEFENQCWVVSENERYELEGLDRVRAVLDELMESE